MFDLKRRISKRRAERIAKLILPYLKETDKVLDFGCGKHLVGECIKESISVDITGIDVINMTMSKLPFLRYGGEKIPFNDKSFDVTYAAFVFHHTKEVESLLKECIRVTKNRIIILEDVYKNNLELMLIKSLDWFGNKFGAPGVKIPLNFLNNSEWRNLFIKLGIENFKTIKIKPFPYRPSRHSLFLIDLKKESKAL